MANNRISVVIDVVTTGAQAGLKNFKTAVADADGAVGKMKAGATTAFDSVKANAGNLALAGGAALAAFGAKAVTEFQNVALEAGRMGEALGIPVEDMSALIEVAGDLGIEAGSLETTIGKMNLAAGKTPGYFDEIGASIVRNKDGTINVRDTFLGAVDALNQIPDAGKRAEAAQKIFGKGWRDIAELVGQGSDDIIKSLGEVSEAKIITDEEVQKARDYREAMDNLGDAMEDVMLVVGEELVPILSDLSGAILGIKSVTDSLPDPGSEDSFYGSLYNAARNAIDPVHAARDAVQTLGEVFGSTEKHAKALGSQIDKTAVDTDGLTSSTDLVDKSIRAAKDSVIVADSSYAQIQSSIEEAAAAQREMDEDTRQATAALKAQSTQMSDRAGFLNLQTSFDELKATGAETYLAVASGAVEAEQKQRDYELAVIDTKQKVIDYAEEVGNIPAEKTSAILALIDEGKLDEAEMALANLMRPRTATGTIIIKSAGKGPGIDPKDNPNYRGATGGIVTQPTYALIGESGPEAVVPLNTAPGASPLGRMAAGDAAPTINITVNAGLGANGPEIGSAVVSAIKNYERSNGAGWRAG